MMVNMQFKTFSINLNDQHVNGMTPFDLVLHSGKLVIRLSRKYIYDFDVNYV